MVLNPKDYVRASDGTGTAVRAVVASKREPNDLYLNVDSVAHWPNKFIATAGTLDEATGTLDPDTFTEFYGHLEGSIIVIEEFCPGYSDYGNEPYDVVVIKPATAWADAVAEATEFLDGVEQEIDDIKQVVGDFEKKVFLATHPVGSTYWNAIDDRNPGDVYGGTWYALDGVVLGGVSSVGPFNVPVGSVIGADTHTLTTAQMPSHNHNASSNAGWRFGLFQATTSQETVGEIAGSGWNMLQTTGSTASVSTTANEGGGQAHNNIQRTLVGYLWQRSA